MSDVVSTADLEAVLAAGRAAVDAELATIATAAAAAAAGGSSAAAGTIATTGGPPVPTTSGPSGVPPVDSSAAALRYALGTGGKRLRPILCLAAADAVDAALAAAPAAGSAAAGSAAAAAGRGGAARGGAAPPGGNAGEGSDWTSAGLLRLAPAARVRAAAAIELVHTYSLVHDDLPCMDDDALRRGRPTTHTVFGTAPAMVAGFALVPAACALLLDAADALDLPAPRRAAAVAELCRAAGAAGMVGGQVLDLAAEGRAVTVAELRRIHMLKTGALFRGALRIGGIIAGATPAMFDALGRFGDGLGLAFQITDDVLDETMDAAALGKTPGKDRGAGKSTFASLLGLDGAGRAAAAEVHDAVAGLRAAGLDSPLLEALAGFAADRDR